MKNKIVSIVFLLVLIFTLWSCHTDPLLQPMPKNTDISFVQPANWPSPHYNFQNNTLTSDGFALGRRLFYDARLSIDNSISCASCHEQTTAFAQIDHAFSHGVRNQLGTRNSPALFNLAWHTSFFWDGGVNHIENQPIAPILNPVEMDETIPNVIAKLNADPSYRLQFKNTFGSEEINTQRIQKAIVQFMATIVSNQSKYDQVKNGKASFTADEQAGYILFQQKCNTCHAEPLFTDFSFRNNGLPSSLDSGRAHITGLASDRFKFKVPSLRNLNFTKPYMHNGSIASLGAVLDHYTNINQSPSVDPLLQNPITLSATDKSNLIAFLNTLNDYEFVKDVRFKQP
jgi:cytochrome c peroxidase